MTGFWYGLDFINEYSEIEHLKSGDIVKGVYWGSKFNDFNLKFDAFW